MRIKIGFIAAALFLGSLAGIGVADAESVRTDYDISVRTYQSVTPFKYNAIYKKVQPNSKRVMLDAARDACKAEGMYFFGPNTDRPFDCSSYR